MDKEVVLTGLRSNSAFHLGNYLGAIKPIIKLQQELSGKYQINMFVPDLHSFTTPIEHTYLYRQTIDNLKVYVASGLDINAPDTYVYRQSYVSAHSELAWILSCFTYFGELSRMTQFKDKSSFIKHVTDNPDNKADWAAVDHVEFENVDKSVSAGLFIYPVLMAADILLYDAKWVPVGEDQRQHLELVRDIATRFNNKFDQVFTVPENWQKQLNFMHRDNGIRIRSLKNPDRKMSKSVQDPSGTIMLTDSPDEAAKKIMSATTDSDNLIKFDWEKKPGVTNLLQLLALTRDVPNEDVIKEWEGKNSYGDLKNTVAEAIHSFLTDLQAKLSQVNEDELMSKLEADELSVNGIAQLKLNKVQKAVGLRP